MLPYMLFLKAVGRNLRCVNLYLIVNFRGEEPHLLVHSNVACNILRSVHAVLALCVRDVWLYSDKHKQSFNSLLIRFILSFMEYVGNYAYSPFI